MNSDWGKTTADVNKPAPRLSGAGWCGERGETAPGPGIESQTKRDARSKQ